MPNIFKAFTKAKAEPYRFPDAAELRVNDPPPLEEFEEADQPPVSEGDEAGVDVRIAEEEPEAEQRPEPEQTPISFAQIQAEQIVAEARREADRIIAQSQEEAQRQTEEVLAKAREEGRTEGYEAGMAQAAEESKTLREEQAQRLEEEVHRFMEHAGVALDRQMDQSVADLRDLAMAVAEKVVCVSLKSSGDVIARMIQTAIDKRKKKEWVHIYIAECDAKRLTQMPASLSHALSALSDRVRIIPMADDESGTCIIEMPDEIVDASASTQLNNLRTILTDASGGSGGFTFT